MIRVNSSYKYIFIILLLFITSASYAAKPIPFTLSAQGHIVIKAKINGVEGNFVFDTGAGLNLITKKFAAKVEGAVKQDGGYTTFRATGEQLTLDIYKIKTLTMGDYTAPNPTLTIIDADLGEYDGLISLMAFKDQPFTIDYQTKEIIFETDKTLTSIKKQGSIVPLQIGADRDKALDIFAYFRVNDKLTLQFSMDSGAGANVYRVNAKYITALGVDTVNAPKTYHASEFNPQLKTTIYTANIQKISVKDFPAINCQNIKASFINGLIYDGIMYINWLGQKITFDLKHEVMIVR